jgi:hypothetical protein
MKGTRFEDVSSIQQTVMRELKAIMEEAFSWAFDSLYERVNGVRKQAGTILSDGINKYFLSFLWPQFGNLIVTLCMYRIQRDATIKVSWKDQETCETIVLKYKLKLN